MTLNYLDDPKEDGETSTLPGPSARATVLRHLPRVLRAGLSQSDDVALAAALAQEVDAFDPATARALAGWVKTGCAYRRDDAVPASIRRLDRLAARRNETALAAIADALLLVTAPASMTALAGRLAQAAWRDLDRLHEVSGQVHLLAFQAVGAGELAAGRYTLDLDGILVDLLPPDTAARRRDPVEAWRSALVDAYEDLAGEARATALGLTIIATSSGTAPISSGSMAVVARIRGRQALEPVERRAARREKQRHDAELAADRKRLERAQEREAKKNAPPVPEPPVPAEVPDGFVMVCPAVHPGSGRDGRAWSRGYEHVVGTPVPLVATPDLAKVRATLVAAFPHAAPTIDRLLAEFAGRRFLGLTSPICLAGPPGVGKSAFAAALADALGVGLYRVDGSNDAGVSLGGTERRWYSSEPCRPLMAIARHRQANTLLLVEEADKAPTRNDHGRLWDGILLFTDQSTSRHYQDPCFQAEIDVSNVMIVLTVNRTDALPGPLLDRLKVLDFPAPEAKHLQPLSASILREIATGRGEDPRFHPPLAAFELDALRRRWRGGSLRGLRRAVEAVLRARDAAAPPALQ